MFIKIHNFESIQFCFLYVLPKSISVFRIKKYGSTRRKKIPQQSTINVPFTRTRDNNSVWENRGTMIALPCRLQVGTCMREPIGPVTHVTGLHNAAPIVMRNDNVGVLAGSMATVLLCGCLLQVSLKFRDKTIYSNQGAICIFDIVYYRNDMMELNLYIFFSIHLLILFINPNNKCI